MRLVLPRGTADCGICALGTVAELSYEDVFVAAAKVDQKHRGKCGVTFGELKRIAIILGFRPQFNHTPNLEEDDGLLAIRWQRGSKHYVKPFRWHYVALAHGVIADPSDGLILPADEYLTRSKATAGALMELA